MVAAIERYLHEEITAHQFDRALSEIAGQTGDQTVRDAAWELWFCYDDIQDHKIVASKELWDYLYRVILLLKSGAHVEVTREYAWTMRQLIAACGLLIFAAAVWRFGFGEHLLCVYVPLGLLSMALTYWRDRNYKREHNDFHLVPFTSVSEIFAFRRKHPGFSKKKYPRALSGRRIRSPIMEAVMLLKSLLFPPVVLFFQVLPEAQCTRKIVTPYPQ